MDAQVPIEMSKSISLQIFINSQMMSKLYPIYFCSNDNFHRVIQHSGRADGIKHYGEQNRRRDRILKASAGGFV